MGRLAEGLDALEGSIVAKRKYLGVRTPFPTDLCLLPARASNFESITSILGPPLHFA